MCSTGTHHHGHGGLILTSPILLHQVHCLFLLLWCTLSHTETHQSRVCVCVSCPCWRRACGRSPLTGWSSFLHRGRRLLMVCWWSSLNTCRTKTWKHLWWQMIPKGRFLFRVFHSSNAWLLLLVFMQDVLSGWLLWHLNKVLTWL